ncbi:Protein of unknown function DUF2006 [Ferrimonas balearica DSM 9799]|uniref:AttH domain-containing protein n=1 Tax=Ferrimonas balearica (strain DSM 9799 / CCM 4581 / KCTC 23876 / PAT) TaxID=550540 RepID=E1ST74_FERBD|nr:lipocalin-like domain-containing protein [Ferrimonas balearica]ADN76121.1 Protein of unknown function DUF2006 [Ferrimonas balearica DSM 9799]
MRWAWIAWVLLLTACHKASDPAPFISAGSGKDVVPGMALSFPRDHGAHPEYGLEWWYVTANLEDERGQHHGLQWTLFRFRGAEGDETLWQGQGYLGHMMHESGDRHRAWQRQGRAPQVQITAQPFAAGIDHWWLRSVGNAFQPLQLVASEQNFAVALSLSDSPLVAHGDRGFSDKSGDGSLASYYYSLPRLQVSGHLDDGTGWRSVKGEAWLDREWSSALLDDRFVGWDWMGLQLADGHNLMLFCLRPAEGNAPHCDGSLISANAEVITLVNDVIDWRATQWVTLDGAQYPVEWKLNIPEREISLTIRTRSQDQRNKLDILYWEGPVRVFGTHPGQGFVEMTGRSESSR